MKEPSLNEIEQLALASLVRALVRADGHMSAEEAATLAELGPKLGGASFLQSLVETSTSESAEELATQVTRPEVQRYIYEVLMTIAKSDGIDEDEAELLRYLLDTWQLR